MPNIVKMTETKKNSVGVMFRFRPMEVGFSGCGGAAATMLKVWCKELKRAEAADNKARHLTVHKGVGRAERRVGLKPKNSR